MENQNQTRCSTRDISERFGIPQSTLRNWRRYRLTNKRYPRYHKLFTGGVFYVLAEFEEDFRNMEEAELEMPGYYR